MTQILPQLVKVPELLGVLSFLLLANPACAASPSTSQPNRPMAGVLTPSGSFTSCGESDSSQAGSVQGAPLHTGSTQVTGAGIWLRTFFDPRQKKGDLQAFPLPVPDPVPPHLSALWSVQQKLASQDLTDRRIFTLPQNSGRKTFLSVNGPVTGQLATLWQADPQTATQRLENFGRLPLGTLIHSDPVLVGAPPQPHSRVGYDSFRQRHQQREPLIYIAANDGMLHAVRASGSAPRPAGSQAWAYLPGRLLAAIPDILQEEHRYRLDLSPVVHDVWNPQWDAARDDDSRGDGDGWRTVLIGGAGLGGDFYFALDITQPDSDRVAPLWEGSPFPGARASTRPAVGPLAPDGHWAAIVTSGYREDTAPGAVAALDIANGEKLPRWFDGAEGSTWITTNSRSPSSAYYSMTDPVAYDSNQDGLLDLAYAGDSEGILWKFHFDRQQRLWRASKHFDTGGRGISTQPTLITDQAGNLRIYFGTGLFLHEDDRQDSTTHAFYCLIEQPNPFSRATEERFNGAPFTPQTAEDLLEVTAINSRAAIESLGERAKTALQRHGWWFQLGRSRQGMSERVINQAIVIAGKVFFTSYTPSRAPCGGNDFSRLYALDYDTGLQARVASSTVLRTSSGGDLPAGRRHGYRARGRAFPLKWIFSKGEQSSKLIFQTDDGTLHQVEPALNLEALTLRAWREIGF
jgi:type IV pilus assembly protein PilY1